MIALPPGFDVSLFVGELFAFAVPFAGVIFLMSTGFLILKMLRRL